MSEKTHTPITREETPFSWYVTCGMPAYAELAGISYERTFYDRDAIIEAYDVGYPRAVNLFGPELQYNAPGWSGISYGHINCLGAPLIFPKGSDVAHQPIYASLEEGLSALQQKADWAHAGMMPDYLELWEQLQQAFPEMEIRFQGFGVEGPITTAWELRGHGFFTDLYDNPLLAQKFISLVTANVVDYMVFQRSVNGEPSVTDTGVGMVDDISALLHPNMWKEFVAPYHQEYFESQTTGSRHAHIEGLSPAHLPYLDALRLDSYDPSVSPTLCPSDIRDGCHVPFWWRLNEMQVRDYTLEQVRDFVYDAVSGGASGIFSHIGRIMLTPEAALRIKVFMGAAKHISELLLSGVAREALIQYKQPVTGYA
jgi:hypothetical protein